jgi:hypothetical protein
VYELPECKLVSHSSHESNAVEVVAGCADLGLIVSVDSDRNMVLETMSDHTLIGVVRLGENSVRPTVTVFKSGIIAVGLEHGVRFFDQRGVLQKDHSTESRPVMIEKYYDFGCREFLIVVLARDGGRSQAQLIDLVTFHPIAEFPLSGSVSGICPIKHARAFLVSTKGSRVIRTISFADKITSVFARAPPEQHGA